MEGSEKKPPPKTVKYEIFLFIKPKNVNFHEKSKGTGVFFENT